MRLFARNKTLSAAMLLFCAAVLAGNFSGTALAGDAWLDANGIRIDNVDLNNQHATNNTYWIDPPFLTAKVQPNVLFVLDNSGSMNDQAYAGSYDPSQFVSGNYFGYFEPNKCYQYSSQKWNVIGDADPAAGCAAFAGAATTGSPVMHANVLNWATMRRVDAAKKLLIGGKANPRSMTTGCCVKLNGEDSDSSWNFSKNFDNSALAGLAYPFSGNYRYSMSGDALRLSPLVAGTSTIDLHPLGDISIPASWSVTPATSAAWQAVDETSSDGNTTTIQNKSTANAPALFDYNYTGAGPGTISSIQVIVVARRSQSGTMRIQGVIQSGGTNYASSYSNLSNSFSTYTFTWTTNPATGLAWAWSEIKSGGVGTLSAFGVQAYTTPTSARYPIITQVYLKINSSSPSGGPYSITVDTGKADIRGIIDELSNDARFGLGFYNTGSNTGSRDGGHVDTYIDFGTPTSMITSIANMVPETWTPLAETLYEMVGYFRQEGPYYSNSPADYQIGNAYDPYYFQYTKLAGSDLDDQFVNCAKSFILMLTDGESTMDQNIPGWLKDVDPDIDPFPDARYPSSGSDYLDDVALWARTTDHRTLAGEQNIVLYSVFMFGRGSRLLMDAAINGGFDDKDGDGKPGCTIPGATQDQLGECYRDSNGNDTIDPYDQASNPDGDLPLTYYQGDDGYELQVSIIDAITAILKRAASGTSVSVLGSSWKGEGSMYQAYFYPEKVEGLRRVAWTGYFHSLFVDRHGLIHEDTVADGMLKPKEDQVLEFEFQPGQDTRVKYFWDRENNDTHEPVPDGKVDQPLPHSIALIQDIKPLWDAGKHLAARNPADRVIYTSYDADSASPPTLKPFDSSIADVLRPYLRAKTDADAANLINFIRGEQISGWRDRQLTVDGSPSTLTWKLGDIVFSDPTVVGAPKERFDIIYNDQTYRGFYNKWKNRRTMVYVGANDGMLHAFNGGYFISTTQQNPDASTAQVTFCEALTAADPPTCAGDPANYLGKELWGFIPFDLLPHLAWLADPDYHHVYYVDNVVRVTDARVFTPDADHVNGWGTILVVSMRFGGGEIDVTDTFGGVANTTKQFKSAYYAVDVTNPDAPALMWRFTDAEMGFTLSTPTFVREGDPNTEGSWYVVMGSGPSNYRGARAVDSTTTNTKFTKAGVVGALSNSITMATTYPYLYINDLKTGRPLAGWTASGGYKPGIYRLTDMSYRFFTNPTAVDYPLDYKYDMLYFGAIGCNSGCSADGYGTWGGRVMRVKTNNEIDPGKWAFSNFFFTAQPITVKPAAGIDQRGNIWVYFGTGRFLHVDDRFDTVSENYYGIKDPCYYSGCTTLVSNGSNLLRSNDYDVNADGSLTPVLAANTLGAGKPPQNISRFDDLADFMRDSADGWKISLASGERVIVNGFVVGGIAGFGSYTPTQTVCEFEGRSRQYYPFYLTGTVPYIPGGTFMFDVSVDSGGGLPSIPAVHIDSAGNVKLFLQKSTGEIQVLEMKQAQSVTGGFGAGGESAD